MEAPSPRRPRVEIQDSVFHARLVAQLALDAREIDTERLNRVSGVDLNAEGHTHWPPSRYRSERAEAAELGRPEIFATTAS